MGLNTKMIFNNPTTNKPHAGISTTFLELTWTISAHTHYPKIFSSSLDTKIFDTNNSLD